jgi:hypothetical protein
VTKAPSETTTTALATTVEEPIAAPAVETPEVVTEPTPVETPAITTSVESSSTETLPFDDDQGSLS